MIVWEESGVPLVAKPLISLICAGSPPLNATCPHILPETGMEERGGGGLSLNRRVVSRGSTRFAPSTGPVILQNNKIKSRMARLRARRTAGNGRNAPPATIVPAATCPSPGAAPDPSQLHLRPLPATHPHHYHAVEVSAQGRSPHQFRTRNDRNE